MSSKDLVKELIEAGRYEDIINILKEILSNYLDYPFPEINVDYHEIVDQEIHTVITNKIKKEDLLSETRNLFLALYCQTNIDKDENEDFIILRIFINTQIRKISEFYMYQVVIKGKDIT